MKRKPILVFTIAGILLAALPVSAGVLYNITDLRTLGGPGSRAYSINNKGRIVGRAQNGSWYRRATLFDSTGRGNNIDLQTLPGRIRSYAYSINDHDQIVGKSDYGYPTYDYRATLFDATGGESNIDLGTLGGVRSKAYSINNNGQIVGFAYEGDPYYYNPHATLFDPTGGGSNIDLGTLGGRDRSLAYSINDHGQIVGEADGIGGPYATLFDPTGNRYNISLGYGKALCINNNGQIVGVSGGIATLFDHTGSGNNIALGTLPAEDSSEALSINNNGKIVGLSYSLYGIDQATLFDPTGNGNNINLNDLVAPASGWNLLRASGINDNDWIVGSGVNPDGDAHAFLLTPVPAGAGDFEPSGDVDMSDFAVLASAWGSSPGDNNWNPACDISHPNDGVIDEFDLAVFSQNWLESIWQ